MFTLLETITELTINVLLTINRVFSFVLQTIYHCIFPPYYLEIIWQQIIILGFLSLPIVAFSSIFTGAVLMLQTNLYSTNTTISLNSMMPGIVLISIVRELGPILISLILAGRISSGIASEIGIMRITDQIDALSTLQTNSFKYLIAPRVIATVLTMPMLIFSMDIIGIFGGYIIGTGFLNYNHNLYINSTISYLKFHDVSLGLIKSVIFGFILSVSGCYHGFYCDHGSQNVGRCTTLAVIFSSIFIILSNYIITFIIP